MKKMLLMFIVLFGMFSALAATPLGIGIIVGEPDAGFCIKAPRSGLGSAVFATSWDFDHHILYLHGDYIAENLSLTNEYDLIFYYGLGIRLLMQNDPLVGIRVPLGISYKINGSPLDCFLEVVPMMDLLPSPDFNPHIAVGLRFFFK